MSLSVIVPTRERPDTLRYCLKTIVGQDDKRLKEIIVSDNCSGPEKEETIDFFKDVA